VSVSDGGVSVSYDSSTSGVSLDSAGASTRGCRAYAYTPIVLLCSSREIDYEEQEQKFDWEVGQIVSYE